MPGFDIRNAAPEETRAIRRAGQKLLDREAEFQFELARFVARSASGQYRVR